MEQKFIFLRKNKEEIIFQIIVFIIVFVFYSYNLDGTSKFEFYKLSFFLNYLFASVIINYVLVPWLYSKKKIILFLSYILLLLVAVITLDELVLEKIYFPKTRGKYFPGIIFTLAETVPIILIFVGFKFAWDYNRKQTEIEQLKNLVQASELQFLKSQIDPHFLFNNLNNLYAHAIEESTKTPQIILELSSVLRYMLYDCQENFVSLNKEINHLKNYTALNELQIGGRGKIYFSSNCQHCSQYKIAPLILTVFIENAFKHSTATQLENIKITINIDINNMGELKLIVINNFNKEPNTSQSKKGIGLENVKKRLSILHPNSHKLIIKEEHTVFSVNLSINLKK